MRKQYALLLLTCCGVFLFLETSLATSGFFWHVTDFHYDPTYWTTQKSCNNKVPKPGPFGDYWCDAPWRLVKESVSEMAAIKSDVDFVLWTGDNVAHIKDQYMSLDEALTILQNTTNLLKTSFPGVPFYPSLGNHDFYPSEEATPNSSVLYRKVALMWKEWIQEPEQISLFKQGGFYTKLIKPGLRILCLNTVLYLTENPLTKNLVDPAGQLAWLEKVLVEARSAGEKVFVTGHVPPTILTPSLLDWFYPQYHKDYIDILVNYADIIIAQHYGHDHSDSFKILQTLKGTGASPVFMAPSVTPWRYKIPTKSGDPHNPGIRLVEYDRETGRNLNYVQYFMNLTDANRAGKTHWKQLYSFTDTYDVEDMSLESLRKIYARLGKPNNKWIFYYCRHLLVSDLPQKCTLDYQAKIYCGGFISDLDKIKKCVSNYVGPRLLRV